MLRSSVEPQAGLTFKVIFLSEAQPDLVSIATGALATLGDAKAEARDAARVGLDTEVTTGTGAWKRMNHQQGSMSTPSLH